MEQYQVHGRWVSFNDVEYGMFASRTKEEGDLEYAMVSLIPFVRRMNQTSREDAIVYLTELQKEAKKQVNGSMCRESRQLLLRIVCETI